MVWLVEGSLELASFGFDLDCQCGLGVGLAAYILAAYILPIHVCFTVYDLGEFLVLHHKSVLTWLGSPQFQDSRLSRRCGIGTALLI